MRNHTPFFPDNIDNYAPWVAESGLIHPYGICQCGCGQSTPIAKASRKAEHSRKGEPLRYVTHHSLQAPWYASLEDYFWTYCIPGDPDECWPWQGSIHSTGYGTIHFRGKCYIASRVSWELHNNQPFPKGEIACHECDNRPCVNPHHIWPGTHRDNNADMVAKRRHAFGERNWKAKLTEEQVGEIRDLHREGHTPTEISQLYLVSDATIGNIVARRTWKHARESVVAYDTGTSEAA